MAKKPNKKIQEEYKQAIKFGCVVCKKHYGVYTEPCIHHLTGAGMGIKSKSFIPLCFEHHQGSQGIHYLGNFTWEDKYGTQEELLEYYEKNK